MLSDVLKTLRQHSVDVDPAAVIAAGREGLAVAQQHATTADGFIAPHVAWAYVMAGVFQSLEDASTEEGLAIGDAMGAGIETVNALLTEEDDREPVERLQELGKFIVFRMVKAWLNARGIETPLPEPSEPPPGGGPAPPPTKPRPPRTYH